MTTDVATTREENQWFRVNPKTIDRSLFEEKREDVKQEKTRKLIKEAFCEFDAHPEKYPDYEPMVPEKTWVVDTIENIKKFSNMYGGHTANWVEQAFKWGQLISNGVSWEDLCNTQDFSQWYRVITWKNGEPRIVGGSVQGGNTCSATDIHTYNYDDSSTPGNVVPLIVRYV